MADLHDETFDSDEDSDSSDFDLTFDDLQETRSRLSRISIKKTRPRVYKNKDEEIEVEQDEVEVEVEDWDDKDNNCFKKVLGMIKDGKLEKLKVDDCKVYLRKYGLRLTGKKDVLLGRIREHLEVIDGKGEHKYPVKSFVINCKGDACTGDVVMFEQKVYEMYNIASRSATGLACGTRIVVGRIVKESYGAAKQQHTFTIEVLWSQGEKALPPLHPLLIKGRNLYRLKTIRQRWADEEQRRIVLQEKHMRGGAARFSKEVRVREKEFRKVHRGRRINGTQGDSGVMTQQRFPLQRDLRNQVHEPTQHHHHYANQTASSVFQAAQPHTIPLISNKPHAPAMQQCNLPTSKPNETNHNNVVPVCTQNNRNYTSATMPAAMMKQVPVPIMRQNQSSNGIVDRPPLRVRNMNSPQPSRNGNHFTQHVGNVSSPPHSPRYGDFHRQPSVYHNYTNYPNLSLLGSPPLQQRNPGPLKLCRYHRNGQCHFGDNCKFLHE